VLEYGGTKRRGFTMSDFLVTIKVNWPTTMSQTERIDLLRREAAVLGELFTSGELQALYHAKDEHVLVGVVRCDGPEKVVPIFERLPMWSIMTIQSQLRVVEMEEWYRSTLNIPLRRSMASLSSSNA
jgi:muconolactone delta-isomerase